LYAQGTADLNVDGNKVQLRQITNYPWDGEVKLEISMDHPHTFTLSLRVPDWCDEWQLAINGVPAQNRPTQNGYLTIERTWQDGDTLTYTMQMPVQPIWAHPDARDLQSKVAMQRGPIVYFIEGTDHPGIPLDHIVINSQQISAGQFQIEHQDNLLGGISILRGAARVMDESEWTGKLYRRTRPSSRPMEITAIPYYAWSNREPGEMRVWIQSAQT